MRLESEQAGTPGFTPPLPSDLSARLRAAVGGSPPPLPGSGRTGDRFAHLAAIAGRDLALGRLAEGHLDAVAILDEAGLVAVPGAVYGVWAARSSSGDLATTSSAVGVSLRGEKGFCSGAGLIDRVLVTADADDGPRLYEVDLGAPGVGVVDGSWPAVGMAASMSATVVFDSVEVDREVGGAGFYTGRIGFWWGAAGVAACWWGGARALTDTVGAHLAGRPVGDHEAAAYGSAEARSRSMADSLRWAADEIDRRPGDAASAQRVALTVRETVHDGATAILAWAAAAGGARPICLDSGQSQRSADLYAYLAQHHVGRDAARLGRLLLDRPPVPGRPGDTSTPRARTPASRR